MNYLFLKFKLCSKEYQIPVLYTHSWSIPVSYCICIYFSDAVTDTKRLFVGTYPGMPHITSGLSVTASNGRQSPRRVSFVTDSDDRYTVHKTNMPLVDESA